MIRQTTQQALRWIGGCLGGFCLLYGTSTAKAELAHQMEEDVVVVTKEISGKVSAISSRFLTLEYASDAKKGVSNEMYLTFGDDVKLRYARSLSEIKFGDTISVQYEEKQRPLERRGPDGGFKRETQVLSRQAKAITFLKAARTGLVSGD